MMTRKLLSFFTFKVYPHVEIFQSSCIRDKLADVAGSYIRSKHL